MIMRLMRLRTSAWVCAMACLGAIPLLGAELKVNLDVQFKENARGGAPTGTQAQKQHATILVIDRSMSMTTKDQPGGKTRWSALLEGVKADLNAEPDGGAVGLVIFETLVMPIQTFSSRLIQGGTEYRLLDDPTARDEIWKRIAANPPKQSYKSATALYDALGVACDMASRLRDNGFTSVSILVHSDGKSNTYKRFKTFDEVKRVYGNIWQQLNELKIEGHWWGRENEIPDDMADLFRLKQVSVHLVPSATRFQNPTVAEKQSINLRVDVDVPRDLWSELEGKDVNLSLRLEKFGNVDVVFTLNTGKQTHVLSLPDDLPKDQDIPGFLVVSGLPESDKLYQLAPRPVQIVFEKPGAVSLNVEQPRSKLLVLKGDVVEFRATGTVGAVFKWQFNGSDVESKPGFSRKLDETVTYFVTASKPGLIGTNAEGKVEVVDADIQVQPPVRNPRVGEPTAFKAVTRGTAGDIQWFVNGRPVQEIVFKQDGPHTVRAQAEVPGVRTISAEIEVRVDPAPIIEIVELDDSIFNAKSNIAFRAQVSGFDVITWTFTGPESKTQTSSVKENAASVELSFAKGGRYTVSASGMVDGKTLVSNLCAFDIRPEDMWVKILEPLESELVVDKAEGVACTFVAQVKGEGIAKIKWSIKHAETGAAVFEDDVRDVDGGKSSATWIFSPIHAGGSIITAAAVFKGEPGEDGALVTGARTIWVRPVGSVSITSPAKNALLPFGATQVFEASATGAVDQKAVSWYQRDKDGKWQPLPDADGIRYSHTFNHTGKSYDFVDFRVAAGGPESQWRDAIRIRLECPPLSPRIVLPATNGVIRTEYGLHERITFGLVANGDVRRVDWDFGDGDVTNVAAGVVHRYVEYGSYTITAKACCSRCQSVETAHAEVKVEKAEFVPMFSISPDKETFQVGGSLVLIDESMGDAESLLWFRNGVEIGRGPRGGTIEVQLPNRPAKLTFELHGIGKDGEMLAGMHERTVRVRFGWWAVVPILLAALLVWWLLFRLLTGNEPRGWTVYAWDGAVPKIVKGGYPEERKYAGKGVPSPLKRHWSWLAKKARIPIGALLGLSEDGEGSGGGWSLASREDRFVFRADGGKPVVACPSTVNEVSGTVGDRDVDHYFLFRDAAGTIGVDREFVRVVVEEGPSGWFCPVVLVLSTFAIIGTVFWLCLKYAV